MAVIIKNAWRRTSSLPPFSWLCPSSPEFEPYIWTILLFLWEQLLALALIILTNTFASSFSITTSLNYPEYLMCAMLGNIFSARERALRFTVYWILAPLLLSLPLFPFDACAGWFSWHNVGVAWSHLPNTMDFLAPAAGYFFIPSQIKVLTQDNAASLVLILSTISAYQDADTSSPFLPA